MHRALKQHLIHLLDEQGSGKLQLVFERALSLVRRAFPRGDELQAPTNHTWEACEARLPHVSSLQTIFESWTPQLKATMPFATLLADTGNHLWERGLVKQALGIMDTGEKVCEGLSHESEVHTVHANICAISSAVYLDIGFSGRHKALALVKKALELRQRRMRMLDENDKGTATDALQLANAWNDLGVILIQMGEYEKAVPSFDESLKLKNTWASEDIIPWHFGETYKNLAIVELSRRNFENARAYATRATSLSTRNMGEKTASTFKAKFVMATVLLNCNDLQASLLIHKEVLAGRREVMGERHQTTKDSFYALGAIYELRNKWDKAE